MSNNYSDFFVNAHGQPIDDPFELPRNVRIIMLCAENVFTAADYNEIKLWHISAEQYGSHLEKFNEKYNCFKTSQNLDTKICVFRSNKDIERWFKSRISNYNDNKPVVDFFNKTDLCPNLQLTPESVKFRTGIFNIPLKFNRIYLNDYKSTTKNEIKKTGTIESINWNDTNDKRLHEKCENKKPLNRLEKLIIQPIPQFFKSLYNIPNEEVKHFIDENINIYKNIITLNSVVLPDSNNYTILPEAPNNTLKHIVENLVQENPNKIITLFVAACRQKTDHLKDFSPGISLDDYCNTILCKYIPGHSPNIMYNKTLADCDYIAHNEFLKPIQIPNKSTIFPSFLSNLFRKKYLKYKKKYLQLKQSVN